MTGERLSEERLRALEDEAATFVMLPVHTADLRELIAEARRARRYRAALREALELAERRSLEAQRVLRAALADLAEGA